MKRFLLVVMVAVVFAAVTSAYQVPRSIAKEGAPFVVEGPSTVVELAWGGGPQNVGRKDGDEAASEGPMSFAVSPSGQFLILDQVNFRVLRLDTAGKPAGSVAIPADTFQDIVSVDDDHFVLLDRLARQSLLTVDLATDETREHSIMGKGIPEGGGVTAMFALHDGIWLEFNHTDSVQVLDAQLHPCGRTVRSGRAHRDGSTRIGARLDGTGGADWWTADQQTGATVHRETVRLDRDIARIIWAAADGSGNTYLFFHVLSFHPEDVARVTHEEVVGVVYDQQHKRRGELRSLRGITQWEQFREVHVTADGTAYQMAFTDTGMQIVRWRWTS